jgi:hypothetical protein
MEVEWLASRSGRFTPHCIGGWVGRRAGLDFPCQGSKPGRLAGNQVRGMISAVKFFMDFHGPSRQLPQLLRMFRLLLYRNYSSVVVLSDVI